VADFRSADMAVGGQGAPLAPFFHQAFFDGQRRAILNLGGIANLTVLGDTLLGFDTGPGNALMDAWCMKHRQQPYDEAGQWARSGQVMPALLTACLADPFFAKHGPKATGRDYFCLAWLEAKMADGPYAAVDVQATLLALTVASVVLALTQSRRAIRTLILCGGGVRNVALVEALQQALPHLILEDTSSYGVGPDWVEAMGFAWLASERMANRAIATQTVTGATRPVVLGGIYQV
jgi:anhydro-N-acetylmuramic acid kinase